MVLYINTVEHCVFIYDGYVKSDSAHVCQREFQQKFSGVDIPARSTIHCLVNKFKTMGLVLDKKIDRKCHILTEDRLANIDARLEHSTRKSLTKLAQQADVLVSSARTAAELLKLCPYKITQVHLLQPRDLATRINFCNWCIQSVNEGTLAPYIYIFFLY
jgi:hypothetical protein